MNTLRSLVFTIWMYGWMAILGILALPTLFLPRAAILWFIRTFARVTILGLRIICGIKVEFRGKEHIPGGPLLIAGKHQAMLDVFIPFLLFKDPVLVMKRELLWYPALGWYALKLRAVAIDRSGGAKTMKQMLAAAQQRVVNEKRQMLIYPEGRACVPALHQIISQRALGRSIRASNCHWCRWRPMRDCVGPPKGSRAGLERLSMKFFRRCRRT